MNAPNRSADVAHWVNTHRHLFKSRPGFTADQVRVGLLIPLCQALNMIEGRNVWGRLIKRDQRDHISHDIIVWKDTREHFDVFIGTELVENTQPSWSFNPPPPNDRWEWLDVGSAEPDQPTEALEARIVLLETQVFSQMQRIMELVESVKGLVAVVTAQNERLKALEQLPIEHDPGPEGEWVVNGETGRTWGHGHHVQLTVRRG